MFQNLYRTRETIAGLTLSPGEVHLWLAPLTAARAELMKLQSVLSADELSRADRFRFEEHRDAFVIARGMLRLLLAHYTGDSPERIHFSYSEYGKPSIAAEKKLSFNLSHSGRLALYGFTQDREIGVDIEQFQAMSDMEQVARRFFSKGEVNDFFSLRERERVPAFFQCWTRKEALVKAVGDGLSLPLDSFRVSLKPEELTELLDSPPEHREKWTLRDVTPCEGYAAALVVNGSIAGLQCTRMEEIASGLSLLRRPVD